MRVIAGLYKGRPLRVASGDVTRPTPDRVRESLFAILEPHIEEATVLDLFAGSGALGIEALSRGAKHATFFEKDRRACRSLIENLAMCEPSSYTLWQKPAARGLAQLAKDGAHFDLVFLDPPYSTRHLARTLNDPAFIATLHAGARVVCEQSTRSPVPTCPVGLRPVDERHWGDIRVIIFDRTLEEA